MKPPAREPDGQWSSMQDWINRATRDIGGMNAVCFDAKDRRCQIGRDFQRAKDEDAYPVRFWHGEGEQSPAEQRRSAKRAEEVLRLQYPWRYGQWTPQRGGRW